MEFEYLRENELFRDLDPLQLAHLASILETFEFPEGAVIFDPGEEARYFFVVRRGRVRISSPTPGGGEEALAFLDQGAYFGELKLFDPSGPYTVRAAAHTACTLDAFPLVELRDLLSADRDLAISFLWNVVKTVARRLQATNDKVAAMAKLFSPI